MTDRLEHRTLDRGPPPGSDGGTYRRPCPRTPDRWDTSRVNDKIHPWSCSSEMRTVNTSGPPSETSPLRAGSWFKSILSSVRSLAGDFWSGCRDLNPGPLDPQWFMGLASTHQNSPPLARNARQRRSEPSGVVSGARGFSSLWLPRWLPFAAFGARTKPGPLDLRSSASDPGGTVAFVEADLPRPGDVCDVIIAEDGRCWRTVYNHRLRAILCEERPAWTGRWRARSTSKADHWVKVWACPDHLEGLTALREFGRRRG